MLSRDWYADINRSTLIFHKCKGSGFTNGVCSLAPLYDNEQHCEILKN
jgi:hypothetical protein